MALRDVSQPLIRTGVTLWTSGSRRAVSGGVRRRFGGLSVEGSLRMMPLWITCTCWPRLQLTANSSHAQTKVFRRLGVILGFYRRSRIPLRKCPVTLPARLSEFGGALYSLRDSALRSPATPRPATRNRGLSTSYGRQRHREGSGGRRADTVQASGLRLLRGRESSGC